MSLTVIKGSKYCPRYFIAVEYDPFYSTLNVLLQNFNQL